MREKEASDQVSDALGNTRNIKGDGKLQKMISISTVYQQIKYFDSHSSLWHVIKRRGR